MATPPAALLRSWGRPSPFKGTTARARLFPRTPISSAGCIWIYTRTIISQPEGGFPLLSSPADNTGPRPSPILCLDLGRPSHIQGSLRHAGSIALRTPPCVTVLYFRDPQPLGSSLIHSFQALPRSSPLVFTNAADRVPSSVSCRAPRRCPLRAARTLLAFLATRACVLANEFKKTTNRVFAPPGNGRSR